ncbi:MULTISPECIES: hypothetical protein [Chryseobacterium]|jgi:hypothetical protein|uniref:Uncharacterized protein n=1 Tax=Chryseobacterium balustinum TaxID=246 RepID=A0AAX2IMB5_9FLAO|nr:MULTISPECIES: hypothetical protein [Chryseobacterium]MDY0932801.1 hypothetical protein [Chryseobacterium sp. CFBP8996]SKC02423.1 hypothetical protein SAMN05421800_12153 [Chryseobacterium balustinum]SQA90687.1 Uncharacterised protein [Chryseobacterium balustinum]
MKKLLVVAAFTVAGMTGSLSAKETVAMKNTGKTIKIATECYVKAYDKNGKYLGLYKVACPKVIVIG